MDPVAIEIVGSFLLLIGGGVIAAWTSSKKKIKRFKMYKLDVVKKYQIEGAPYWNATLYYDDLHIWDNDFYSLVAAIFKSLIVIRRHKRGQNPYKTKKKTYYF